MEYRTWFNDETGLWEVLCGEDLLAEFNEQESADILLTHLTRA